MHRAIIIFIFVFGFCNLSCDNITKQSLINSISKIEMHLSAFGVESDDFPSIDVCIDFVHDSSNCVKSYYNPAYKSLTYKLSQSEMKKVLELLKTSDLEKLKKEYRISKTDQPTSTTTIYMGQQKLVIKDYGLEGDYPLQEL